MLVMALPTDTQLHRFQLPDSRSASLGNGRAILSLYAQPRRWTLPLVTG